MPAVSNIVLADATPANHTFVPVSVTPDQAVWLDRDGTTAAGSKELVAQYSRANGARKTDRVKIRLNIPYEATSTDTGKTYVAYTARFSCDIVLPDEMSATERGHVAALIKNALADSVLNGYISDLDPAY
jgi:hypothetical protein